MLINSASPNAERYVILDCKGNKIPYVTAFDTETNEIEIAMRVLPKEGGNGISFLSEINSDGVPGDCLLRFKLAGAYAEMTEVEAEVKEEVKEEEEATQCEVV